MIAGSLVAVGVLTASQATAADSHLSADSGPQPRTAATTTAGAAGSLGPLAGLVIERLLVSDDVAASKYGTDSPIEDPVREEQVLAQVRQQAAEAGVDPDAATDFFRDQITASKVVQRGLYDRWAAHPDEAPTTRPDLARIRERLDRPTTALLHELKETERVREQPVACTVRLALAGATGAAREHLDGLHLRALRTATGSVC